MRHLDASGLGWGIADLWEHGLGKTNGFELLVGVWENGVYFDHFFQQLLLANAFQLIASFSYLFVNNILTRQFVAEQWTQLLSFKAKKPLRVSWPRGLQRSSHMLSLPLRYFVTSMALCILLHWLISQSIFIVLTEGYIPGVEAQRQPRRDASRIGYSTIRIVLSIITWGAMILGLVLHSAFRRYRHLPTYFPRMGTNSVAISAVCHRPLEDKEASLFPVSMGIIPVKRLMEPSCCAGRLALSTWVDLQEPVHGTQYLQPTPKPT